MIRAIKPSTFRRRAAVARKRSSAIGFTLVELLIVIAIIALMASALLVALAGAKESARVARTRSQIARIHAGFHRLQELRDQCTVDRVVHHQLRQRRPL